MKLNKKESKMLEALTVLAEEDLSLLTCEAQMLWNKLCWKNAEGKKYYRKVYNSYRNLLK